MRPEQHHEITKTQTALLRYVTYIYHYVGMCVRTNIACHEIANLINNNTRHDLAAHFRQFEEAGLVNMTDHAEIFFFNHILNIYQLQYECKLSSQYCQ